jgi:hypothetical protein
MDLSSRWNDFRFRRIFTTKRIEQARENEKKGNLVKDDYHPLP